MAKGFAEEIGNAITAALAEVCKKYPQIIAFKGSCLIQGDGQVDEADFMAVHRPGDLLKRLIEKQGDEAIIEPGQAAELAKALDDLHAAAAEMAEKNKTDDFDDLRKTIDDLPVKEGEG